MRVRDAMSAVRTSDRPQEVVRAAAAHMWSAHSGPLVVAVDGRLLGVLDDGDVLSVVARGFDPDTLPVSAAMNTHALTVPVDLPLAEAAELMVRHRLTDLPVVQDGQVVGLLRATSVVEALLQDRADAPQAPAVVDLDAAMTVEPYADALPAARTPEAV